MDAGQRLRGLTRVGFAARGLLYIIIGWLIFRTGRAEDLEGALEYLAGGGKLLMIVVTAGFLAYGFWRLCDAALNIEGHPDDGKGKRERLGAAASGIVYLLLAWQAIRLVRGSGLGSSGDAAQENARTALSLPGGEVMLVVAGLVLVAVGFIQLIRAAKASFLKHLEAQVAGQPWARWTGQFGYAARGLIFIISGIFLFKAGIESEAGEAGGIESALAWLDSPWDMLAAFGLMAFGLYSLVEARFRIIHRVPVEQLADRAAPDRMR